MLGALLSGAAAAEAAKAHVLVARGWVNSSYCIGNGGSYVKAAGTERRGAERIRRA